MNRGHALGRLMTGVALGSTLALLAGCDVNAGTRTSAPQPTTLGAAANTGAGLAATVQSGNHQSDATPDKMSDKTGRGTETGK